LRNLPRKGKESLGELNKRCGGTPIIGGEGAFEKGVLQEKPRKKTKRKDAEGGGFTRKRLVRNDREESRSKGKG